MRLYALIFILILNQSQAIAAEYSQCLDEAGEAQRQAKFVCELERKANKCDEFFERLEKNKATAGLVGSCDVSSTNSEIAIAGLNCSPLAVAAGAWAWGQMSARAGSTIGISPAVLRALPKAATFFAVLAPLATSYSLYAITGEAFSKDKECFEDIDGKRNVLEFLRASGQNMAKAIEPYARQEQVNSVSLPLEYLDRTFIQRLSCQELRQLVKTQMKKRDVVIGQMLATGRIKSDPRKDGELSEKEKTLLKVLTANSACLSAAKQAELICAIGNLSLGAGGGLKKYLDGIRVDERRLERVASVGARVGSAKSFIEVKPFQGQLKVPIRFQPDTRPGYRSGGQGPTPFTGPTVYETAAPGSLSENLKVAYLGDLDAVPQYGFPDGPKLNEIFKLDSKSEIRAIATHDVTDADIYHRSLGRGDVEIAVQNPHDSVDHFVGFLWLSKTEGWKKAKDILSRYYKFVDSKSLKGDEVRRLSAQSPAFRYLKQKKEAIADDLEDYTDRISVADRTGNTVLREQLVNDLNQRIERNFSDAELLLRHLDESSKKP